MPVEDPPGIPFLLVVVYWHGNVRSRRFLSFPVSPLLRASWGRFLRDECSNWFGVILLVVDSLSIGSFYGATFGTEVGTFDPKNFCRIVTSTPVFLRFCDNKMINKNKKFESDCCQIRTGLPENHRSSRKFEQLYHDIRNITFGKVILEVSKMYGNITFQKHDIGLVSPKPLVSWYNGVVWT